MMTLSEFLDSEEGSKFSRAEWARRFGITRGYLSQLSSGNRSPRIPLAVKIEDETEGKVSIRSWVRDEGEV